ncbi:MAG: tail fiber assembly protein [Parvibaculum sedimenti]|uniref:tail fiber assembly protein n=1 Tax=Parvibaculum sedimenti TaxID=2608632 RepID=UPI003BB53C3F
MSNRIYYSASTGGFYNDRMHGLRLLTVVDPDWLRPMRFVPDMSAEPATIEVPDPNWQRPTIEVQGEDGTTSLISDPDAQPAMCVVMDPNWQRPMIEEPDPDAEPDLIEVDNPDCKLPLDAVEITAEEHAALLDEQANGKVISAGVDGKPVALDPPAPTAEELWARVRRQRDALLSACDWTQMSDAPLAAEVKAAWTAYRQALRDIPETQTDPANIVWPAAPGSI